MLNRDLKVLAVVVVVLLGAKAFLPKEEETFRLEPVYLDEAASELKETILADPFNPDEWLDSPFTLDPEVILGPAEEECVDTYLRSDISCADKEAVIKFRNWQQDEEVKRLKLKIEKLERENLYKEFGMREC